ncbi:GRIP1-associated protein 1-like isoform X2 [Dysidea avara]|uniref:GRIP1-associated protein 1-like isoform X2 n=1 Tax=Dysidea avara TaxID=196820 RepID=UPI003322A187
MAAESLSIGEEEFQRLQTQLIELRTANYQLKENNAKQNAELNQLQETLSSQTRELERANKALQKSKKAKEVSGLLEDNENLQKKIEAQENDFKLQNKTMMEEISQLTDQLKQATVAHEVVKNTENNDYRRLQAENAALKKSLESSQNHVPARESIDDLFEKLKHVIPTSTGDTVDGSNLSTSEDDECLKQLESIKEDYVKSVLTLSPDTTIDGETMQQLQLRLTTTEEEKKIIQDQLKTAQEAAQLEIAQLKKEVEKWTEKAKKKQDSYIQLQEEKEKQYQQQKMTYEEKIKSRDAEIKALKDNLSTAQESFNKASHETAISEETAQELDALRSENESLKTSVLLVSQEAQSAQEILNKNVGELMEENSRLASDKMQSDKLAESRKNMLDEMSKDHQENLKVVERRQETMLSDLRQQLDSEKDKTNDLSAKCHDLEQQLLRLQSLAEKISSYEQQLQQSEEQLTTVKQETDEKISLMEKDHQNKLEELNGQLTANQTEIEANKKVIVELEMMKQDKESEIKIVEKKTSGLIRDLRRQMQQMQKKEEKLQQQLNNTRLRDDVVLSVKREISHDTSSLHSCDSSVSSLRAVLGDTASSNLSSMSGNQEEPLSIEESKELMGRIAQLQQDKATLEERVSHLENTGSALAEDVMQKSAIINQYFMENKADHEQMDKQSQHGSIGQMISPLKLMQRMRGSTSESLQETNRKMQRALEEALMKNIHLQKNIDMLSSQLQGQTTGLDNVPTSTSS